LWLANRKDIMQDKRNTLVLNILGGLGFLVVLLTALRVLYLLVLRLS
jgi:Mn2+/Fe2+ NRAMP family transporter